MNLPPQDDPRSLHATERVLHEEKLARARLEAELRTRPKPPDYTMQYFIAGVLILLVFMAFLGLGPKSAVEWMQR